MPTTFSMVRWIPRRTMIRCSAPGMTTPLTTSAIAAVMNRCGASCTYACQATESDTTGVQRERVQQRKHPVLVEQQEAHEDQRAGQKMRDVERRTRPHVTRDTNNRIAPSNPSISATPRNSGTRNTRIFAVAVSNKTNRSPPTASFEDVDGDADPVGGEPAPATAIPHGANTHAIERHVEQELQRTPPPRSRPSGGPSIRGSWLRGPS